MEGEKKMSEEKRKEASVRLKSMVSERQEKKREENENLLNELMNLKDLQKNEEKFQIGLKKFGFDKESKLTSEIKKLKKKLNIEEVEAPEELDEKFLEIPDEQLTEEEIKKKRRMKLLVGGKKAREKKRKEKETLDEEIEKKRKIDQELKEKNPEKFLQDLKENRKKIIHQIEKAKSLKNEMKDRKSNVSKQRLKAMASAIDEENMDESFGTSDQDWNVYKLFVILFYFLIFQSKEVSPEDEIQLENILQNIDKEIEELEEKMGITKNDYYSVVMESRINLNIQQMNQLHLTVERFRVPEILFQPG
jgi:actin-related protein 5